VAVPVLYIRYS